MHFVLSDTTGTLKPEDLSTMVDVANRMGARFALDHGMPPESVVGAVCAPDGIASLPSNVAAFIFAPSDPNAPGALGYHDEEDGRIVSRLLTDPILQNGGGVLDASGGGYSCLSVFTHELFEAILDPDANLWVTMPDGRMLALEASDPVEGTLITDEESGLQVSNYVLPAYFDPQASTGPFDAAGQVTAPFELMTGGYQIILDPAGAQPTEVFGAAYPAWRKPLRQRHIRRAASLGSPFGDKAAAAIRRTVGKCGTRMVLLRSPSVG